MTRNALSGLFALGLLLAVTLLDLAPPGPSDAPPGAFSAVRAHEHLKVIARAPHPTGTPEHTRVRDHLVAELRSLGLDVRVQEGVGVLPLSYDGVVPMGRMRNIVATLPGTAPTGRVVLAAHYDSVAAGPGASDDGAGVATVLEVARALPRKARNDVVFLLTDGEEPGLLGAEAFARRDPGGTVVVLNNEARGSRGTVQMFRASPGSGPLISLYGSTAPHPSADSAFASMMGLLPNNTDFHVFDRAGWMGLDSAYTGGGAYYHSPLDDAAHLDLGSLQQMGDNSLALTRALAGTDLGALRSGGELVYFTVPGMLVRYPAWLEVPVAAAALALACALFWTLRRRNTPALDPTWPAGRPPSPAGRSSLPRALGSAGVALLLVVVTAAAGYALWPLLTLLRPEYGEMLTGDPYRPWPYQAALLSFTTALVLAARRFLGSGAPAVLPVALIGIGFAAFLPGGSHPLTWSALFAAGGWLVARRVRGDGWRVVALTLGAAPAVVLLGGTALASFDVGLKIGGLFAASYWALMLLLVLPLIEMTRWAWLVPLVAAVGLVAAGLVVDRFDAAYPRQRWLVYAMDAGTGQAVWGRRSQETTGESVRWFGEKGWAAEPAPPANSLGAPALAVVKDVTSGGRRTLTLRLTPTGRAPVAGLSVTPRAALTVDGRDLRAASGFAYHAPSGPIDITLAVRAGAQARIRIFERAYDLSVVPGYRRDPRIAVMGPMTTVFREVTV
ncbi:Peptidase family M28 [Nonomuraea solani]|uniref:Peptidase family M28 n=1 Tax=Nonomuraea solani TaxID=1144553 RepID=A0A1H6ENX1_9ACTN|nr:M20/M25/M40 family metallo-hydrolase [Nonomuraea solani]SEG98434.1 Peptidase family M28 [Nonomuraea solani]